jgi:hypothetical protein
LKAKEGIVSACKDRVIAAVTWVVLYPLVWALLCVVQVGMGLVHAGGWAVGSVLKLVVGVVRAVACAFCAVLKGVVFVGACPFACVFWLALVLVRSLFHAVARGPVALKCAMFGRSRCTAVVEFDPCLADLSVGEICAWVNPHRHPYEKAW